MENLGRVFSAQMLSGELRAEIWNAFYSIYLRETEYVTFIDELPSKLRKFIAGVYAKLTGKSLYGGVNSVWLPVGMEIRTAFHLLPDREVFRFIEFVVETFPDEDSNRRFIDECNRVFERYAPECRIVDKKVVKFVTEEEISEIEEALEVVGWKKLEGVREHLGGAIKALSNGDYRNCVKESVCAIESLCRVVTGKATLGELLKVLKKEEGLHPALASAFSNLYGYASEVARHGMVEIQKISYEDAKFALVVCSAFINYVLAKLEGKPDGSNKRKGG